MHPSDIEDANEWDDIADTDVRMHWRCTECGDIALVAPTYYENAGTPVCVDHDDMEYVGTEIRR